MAAAAYGESVKGFAQEQEVKLALAELKAQRSIMKVSATIFAVLHLMSYSYASLVSFRYIGLFNGTYFLFNMCFTLWQEQASDIDGIRRRDLKRLYLHALFSTLAYIVYIASQDEYNKDITEMGSLFVWPLSMAWESRGEGSLHLLSGYLMLHMLMTIVRCGSSFFTGGWQKVVICGSVNILIFNLARGRDTVLSDKNQLASLCSTIQKLLRTICDGYCVMDSDGVIQGADVKLKNLLAIGLHGSSSSITGCCFDELLAEESPTSKSWSEGLRTRRFNTGDGSTVTAEVYTVECTLTPASIQAIVGQGCAKMERGVKGFLCAMRHLSISESGTTHDSGPYLDILEAADLSQSDVEMVDLDQCIMESIDTATPTEVGGIVTGLEIAKKDRVISDVVSVSDLLSEAPSLQKQSGPGGFFPSTRTIGIGVGDYTKVEIVSRGAQGAVWKVDSSSGERFAMKELRLPGILWRRDFTANLVRADREVRCLKRLQWASSVIVKTIDCWLREDMTLCIVMEWLPLTLKALLTSREQGNQGPPPGEDVSRWLAHIVAGIAVIHSEGFLHRDIKPSNLLLTADMHRCKVADLGLSREIRQPVLPDSIEVGSSINGSETASTCSAYTAKCGTRGFQSPEILKGGSYDSATDIFSLGCVLFGMLSFSKSDVAPLTPKAAAPLFPQPRPTRGNDGCGVQASAEASLMADLQQLCLQMLREVPSERPTALVLAQNAALAPHTEALVRESPDVGSILSSASPGEKEECFDGALGVVQLDARGLVLKWSTGVVEALGVPRESAVGRRLLENFIPSKDRMEFSRLVGPVVRGLAKESHGPVTLQGASRKLRFLATVRCGGESPALGGTLGSLGMQRCLGLTMELKPLRPPCSQAVESQWQVPSTQDALNGGGDATSKAAGKNDQIRSTPAHLVSLRPAEMDSDRFAGPEGLHERHIRAWSAVGKLVE